MAWKFWKSEHERFEEEMRKAFDNRNKNKIDKAIDNFLNAYKIAYSSSDPSLQEKGKIAYAYAMIYSAIMTKNPESLRKASEYLKTLREDIEFDLALPQRIKAGELAEELYIASLYYTLPPIDLGKASSMSIDEAKRLRELGEFFISKGSKRLITEDLLEIKEPPNVVGLRLLGYSKLIEASHMEKEDLNKSIELYAEALAYFQQVAETLANTVKVKIDKLGKATKCWVCGRSVQGEEVNFVYLDSFLTKYILERYSKDAPNIVEASSSKIAICSACYGAMYNLSDKIARYYYDEAIKALRALEERLLALISQLQAQIAMIQSRISTLESSIASLRSSMMFRGRHL